MKVSTEIDNNFGYEKITQLVDNIPLNTPHWYLNTFHFGFMKIKKTLVTEHLIWNVFLCKLEDQQYQKWDNSARLFEVLMLKEIFVIILQRIFDKKYNIQNVGSKHYEIVIKYIILYDYVYCIFNLQDLVILFKTVL